jgi:D-alanyl-D-alanine dipeptidase
LKNGQKVIYLSDGTIDTWTSFDLFDKCSSHECHHLIDDHYIRNRNIIKDIMICSGFSPLVSEWWHYSLIDEPFPNTYFDFEF